MQKYLLLISVLANILMLAVGIYFIDHMGGLKYFVHKVNNRGLYGQYEHRKALFESMELPENKIVFLGNSLTEQCEWAELFANPNIYNRGISGDGTAGVIDRVGPIIKAKPSQVFLMIGINDLLFISKSEIIKNYESLLSILKDKIPESEVVIQSILPVNNNVKRIGIKNADILDLNKSIRGLSEKYGYEYVDLHSLMKDETNSLKRSFTEDGIHLNANGYLAWKKAISNLIKN